VNTRKVVIGMDVEFMAYKSKKQVFPVDDIDLRSCGCDEFGHCVEIRPRQADNKKELLFNIMSEMDDLPKKFLYKSENKITMNKKEFFRLLKRMGSKEISQCKNIYGADILDDPPVTTPDSRYAYCGMHIHVSKHIDFMDSENNWNEIPLNINAEFLTYMFDEYIFDALKMDTCFYVGKYRQPGFYEPKGNYGHFEYRSLGVSAFTPKRVSIIFDMVKLITENADMLLTHRFVRAENGLHDAFHTSSTEHKIEVLNELDTLKRKLEKTTEYKGNLKTLWIRW